VAARGALSPSALGGYERAERTISLGRFCELAAMYGIPPDRLLAEALGRLDPEGRESVVIDLTRLSRIQPDQQRQVAEFLHRIRDARGDLVSAVITLRSGDLEALAFSSGLPPRTLLARLRPVLREE
jgi:hypothetical protein